MGRKKAQLLTRDQYGRHVAAERAAALIHAQLTGTNGPYVLRLEHSRYEPWGDLTEEHRSETGSVTLHVWQVKRQVGALKLADFEDLMRALAKHPSLLAHLALYSLVDVRKAGPLGVLSELCTRLSKPGIEVGEELELTRKEKTWLQVLEKAIGGSEREALALLTRLEVRALGSELDLQRNAMALLHAHFEDAGLVHTRLITFFAERTDGALPITYELLDAEVLKGCARRLVSGTASLAAVREDYLEAVVAAYRMQLPLRMLSGRGNHEEGPRLVDVFSMPALQDALEGSSLSQVLRNPRAVGNVYVPPSEDAELPVARRSTLHTNNVRLSEQLLDDARLAERPRFLVEGGVGMGKSTLLEHLRYLLAERALKMPTAPIPVRVEARELAEGIALAVQRSHPALDPRLLQAHPHGFIFLVDGLDEVEHRRAAAVQERLHHLSTQPSTLAMVLAGRPLTSYVQLPPGFNQLQVVPWDRAQVQEFLDKWRTHDLKAVEALGGAQRIDALFPVLMHPLTATFALLLAHEEPEVLRSRAELFRGIVEKLFNDWASNRTTPEGATSMRWGRLAAGFRQLAWEGLRSERETLSRGDLRRLLGRAAMDEEPEWVDAAHRRFGLLVCQPDRTYRFLFKGLAEHLAGGALLEKGGQALREAAAQRWGLEPVRHAIGLGVERHGTEWALAFIRTLLPSRRFAVHELRPLLVAAHVALDLGEQCSELAGPISDALCLLLTMETSAWTANVVADVCRELARQGGACWAALLRKLTPRLMTEGNTASWYAAQEGRTRDEWVDTLGYRDPAVRCVAIERLAAWVDEPDVRDILMDQVLDETQPAFLLAPAYRAGLVLRGATRDADFAARIPDLVSWARAGGQLTGGAAALSLRPQEAPPEVLVASLNLMAQGGWVHWVVVEELAASPVGQAALDAGWPAWRESRDKLFPIQGAIVPMNGPLSANPPLSQGTLSHVLRVVAPVMMRDRDTLRVPQGYFGAGEPLTREACEDAWDNPRFAVEWLKTAGRVALTQEAEILLGEAAARHPALRAALLARWEREDLTARGTFPGGALSRLVEQGDEEAAKVYAAWLDVTVWLRLPFESVFLWPTALRHRLVRPVAIQKALHTWDEFRVGTLKEDGARTTLWGGTVASILGALRPAWEGQTDLKDRLVSLGREGFARDLSHALAVYATPPHLPELAEVLVQRFDALSEEVRDDEPWLVSAWMDWAVRAGVADRLRGSLEKVFSWDAWPRYMAARALVDGHSERAREVSRQASAIWPVGWAPFFLRRSVLAHLVRANPAAWHQRSQEVMTRNEGSARANFELVRELVTFLDPSQRRELLERLYRRLLRGAPPRWLQMEGQRGNCISFEDMFARILFEAGDIRALERRDS